MPPKTSLVLNMNRHLGILCIILNSNISRAELILAALPSARLILIKLADLLKRQALGFVDHKVHENNSEPAEATPDPEHIGLGWVQSTGEIGRDVGEEPVEEPVCGGSHGKRLGTHTHGRNLSRDDPGARTEGGCWRGG